MKLIGKYGIWLVILILMVVNVYVFVSGVKLGDEISRFDREIARLNQENLELEKKVFSAESLNHAASVAAQLDFTNGAPPVYLENQTYALNR